jgi:hypothetical protein
VDEPTEDGKKKKEKKFRFGSKSQPVPTVSSNANVHAVDQDRTLNGLSPAAQLARQHTLRSKTEGKDRSAQPEQRSPGADRRSDDPYDSDDASDNENDDVTARMNDLQVGDDTRTSHDLSREWDENGSHWGQGYVDRHAIPARGILKSESRLGVSDRHPPHTNRYTMSRRIFLRRRSRLVRTERSLEQA